MNPKTFAIATLLACLRHTVSAVPTWPASTDELEDILFLTTGYRSRDLASLVTPCLKGLSTSRVTAAEWIRTAFHDSISGNIYTGVGGLDGSIAWEVNTLENEGVFADDSVAAWAHYVSDLTSLSDVIAAATYASTRSCSNISLAVRGGRVDATQAGPVGFVPQPQNAVGIFRNQFARMGLDDKGMIQIIACGHSIGGVHGADHPEITDSSIATFDTTPNVLDNAVAVEYVSGTTKDPLVVGKSVANKRNSDFNVFSQTDKNVTIKALAADPALFASACKSTFEKMIDLVPTGVKLSDPIVPYEIKPYGLQLTLLDGGSRIRFTGDIRVRTTLKRVSQVQLAYTDRNGNSVQTLIGTTAKGLAGGFDDSFMFFAFSSDLPADTSISTFNVSVTYDDSTQTTFDNNGAGFRMQDGVIYQASQSCLNSSGKLTVVAAVRDAQNAPNMKVLVKVPQASPNVVPSISTTTLPMATQSTVGSYQLYSATLALSPSMADPPVFGVFGDSSADTRKGVSGLPTSCKTLATPNQSSSSSVVATLSSRSTSSSDLPSTIVSSSSSVSSSTSASLSPTPTSPGEDWSFKGCYYDAVTPRALSAKATSDDEMTVDKCAASCLRYQYFGVEYSRECYCGNVLDTSSTSESLSDCNMPCGGSSTQLCGGYAHISLYTNLKYSTPSIAHVPGYTYQGCYSEGNNTRALQGRIFNSGNMTVDHCASLCSNEPYFGVEFSQYVPLPSLYTYIV